MLSYCYLIEIKSAFELVLLFYKEFIMSLTRRLDANHDMTFGRGLSNFCTDAEACAQNVRTRLYLLQGEWFLDTDAGMPYLQKITQKPADLAYAEAVIKQTILGTDGINSIKEIRLLFNPDTRNLNVYAFVDTIYGTLENIEVVL